MLTRHATCTDQYDLLPRRVSRRRLGRRRSRAHRRSSHRVRRSCRRCFCSAGVYVHRGRFDDAMRAGRDGVEAERSRAARAPARRHGRRRASSATTKRCSRCAARSIWTIRSRSAHFWLGNLYRDRGDIARACHEYENVVRDWERHTLELTEEFASDLTAEQLVGFCSDSARTAAKRAVARKR